MKGERKESECEAECERGVCVKEKCKKGTRQKDKESETERETRK